MNRKLLVALALFLATSAVRAEGVADGTPDPLAAARAHFEARRNPEALAAFEQLAASDPRAPEPQFYLGMLALRRNEPAVAVAYLERAAQLDPKSVTYQLRLGDAYGFSAMKAGIFSKMGFAKKCRAQYEKAVELGPENLEARWSLMEFYKQAPGFAGGSNAKAHDQADAIVKFNLGAGRWAHATIFLAEKKYDELFAPFADVLRSEPPDYAKLNQFGRLTVLSGQRLDDGASALKKCLTLPVAPNEPGHAALNVTLGQLEEKRGDKSAARVAYEAALALDANFKAAKDALAKLK